MRRTLFLLALATSSLALAGDAPPERVQDTWDLSAVYPTQAAWEGEMQAAGAAVEALRPCQGHVATQLRDCLDRRFAVAKQLDRLHTYASNHSNENTGDDAAQGRSQRTEMLWTTFEELTASFAPELIAMGAPTVEAAIKADPALSPYDHYLRSTLLDAAHTLDPAGEALLASTGTIMGGPERAHSILVNAELPWPTITLANGEALKVDSSTFTNVRGSTVRADRKAAFEAYYGALKTYEGTIGALLDAAVQGHWTVARNRHYETSVAAAMASDHLPPAIYTTLVAQTNHNLPTLHRYLKLRAKMLGVTDLAYYDLYPPMVNLEKSWTIDEARALTLASVAPLGTEYVATMTKGFDGRWMDVYPRPGKSGGAYMDGAAYDVHPFLLLNYTGDYDSVSTTAHEWGHAMHSVLAARAQPYAKSNYATFIAEIASTFNEALLLEQMLKAAKTDEERLYYLGTSLENLRTTYFRQAQFAEFELAIHTTVEKGEPLTGASLSATYLDILRRYYGAADGVTRIDDIDAVEWTYISHFYYNYYVYQYSTSIAASALLAEDVLAKKPGALDRYLTLLKAGGSDDPYVLLKNAGVDMATPAPYDALAHRMDAIMDQMEAILAKPAKGGKKTPKR